MVGDNKILTVSYGTFSCTLEGFEDPFGSMREIAEYFRDLAADDRYFGAEPPTPDPERLQMIARANGAQAVEAVVTPSGSHALRQIEEPAEAGTEELPRDTPDETAVRPVGAAEEDAPAGRVDAKTVAQEGPDEAGNWKLAEKAVQVSLSAGLTRAADATGPDANEVDAPEPTPDDDRTAPAEEPRSAVEKLARIRAVNEDTAPVEDEEAAVPTTESIVTGLREAFRDSDDIPRPAAVPPDAETIAMAIRDDEPEEEEEEETAPDDLVAAFDAAEPEHARPGADEDDMRDTPEAAEEPVEATQPAPGKGATILKDTPIDDGAGAGNADRIFQEADSQLEGNDTRRRHAAIAHLKAAVSATVADRNILGWRMRQNAEEEVAYREDLAKAVRPAPVGSRVAGDTASAKAESDSPGDAIGEAPEDPAAGDGEAEAAPETPRPGAPEPLVLGMTQRVPNPPRAVEPGPGEAAAARAPEAAARSPRAGADESFAEFAERVGATGLSELLEAAAAYSGQIQGYPQFSRPQIMKHVADASEVEYTREDGLRSFGILLRQGKFEKSKRGLFVLSDRSRFMAGNRLAGE